MVDNIAVTTAIYHHSERVVYMELPGGVNEKNLQVSVQEFPGSELYRKEGRMVYVNDLSITLQEWDFGKFVPIQFYREWVVRHENTLNGFWIILGAAVLGLGVAANMINPAD